jgi:hypothetical protein
MVRENKRENSSKSKKKKVAPKKVLERRDENKEKFLEKLEDMPIIQVAASQTGVHRSTYYRWYEEDPDFKDRADKALKAGTYFINDMMESLLIKLAKDGKIVPIIFWLKHHHPSYMEIKRYEHFHRHEFEENVLTEERMRQIDMAIRAWTGNTQYEDERNEDYEPAQDGEEKKKPPLRYDDEGNLMG